MQRKQKEGLEFNEDEYKIIDEYCKKRKIEWFASAWDTEAIKFLKKFNLKYNKIASAMLTHYPLIEEVAKEGKHTFISTGMSTEEDISFAVETFKKSESYDVVMSEEISIEVLP